MESGLDGAHHDALGEMLLQEGIHAHDGEHLYSLLFPVLHQCRHGVCTVYFQFSAGTGMASVLSYFRFSAGTGMVSVQSISGSPPAPAWCLYSLSPVLRRDRHGVCTVYLQFSIGTGMVSVLSISSSPSGPALRKAGQESAVLSAVPRLPH